MDAEKIVQMFILAVVQGVAEFLPISSSGHLVILGAMLPGETSLEDNLAINIALHLGTLGSILVVYRRELRQILTSLPMLAAIVIATIPVVIVGFTLKETLEAAFNTPAVAATGLLVTAFLLWLSEWLEKGISEPQESTAAPTWKQALTIGLFQAVALVPGLSRSGSTIAGGIMSGVSRELAAKFSFLIAIPAISGATLLQGIDMYRNPVLQTPVSLLLIGALVSFVVGVVALEGLLKIVRQRRLRWFSIYCLLASAVTWTWILLQK